MKIFTKRNIMVIILIVAVILAVGFFFFAFLQKPEKKVVQASAKASIHLEVWTFFDMNTPDDYYRDLWKEMGQEYGYDIDIQFFSTQQIKDKLKIAAAEKNLPDIFLVWGGTYPDYLFDAGACIPVQEYLKEAKPAFLDSYTVPYEDGNNYIIPCLPEAYAVTYVNEQLIDKMGLTVPETWDDLQDMVSRVRDYNEQHGTNYAAVELGDKDSWLGELLFDQIVNQADPSAWEAVEAGSIEFTDPVFEQAAQKVNWLIDQGAFPDEYIEVGEVEAVERFINGEAVLFPHQSTIIYYLMKNMGEDAFSLSYFPAYNSKEEIDPGLLMDINHTQRPGLCVCSYGSHTEEAARLCVDFAERVNAVNVSTYGYINMTSENLSLPSDLPAPVEQLQDILKNEKKSTAYPYALMPQKDADAFRSLTKRFYAGEYDAEAFLSAGSELWK